MKDTEIYGGKTKSEVDNDIKTSKYRLDSENEMLPSLYDYYSDLLSDAKTARNTAEEELNAVQGERELFYRNEDNFPKDIKFTEAAVKALLVKDEAIRRQEALVIVCKSRVYKLEKTVRALEIKKNTLDNLTVLWSKGYYSHPDGGKPWDGGNDEAQKQARKSLRDRGGRKGGNDG